MANEFKVKKGLLVDGTGTVLDVQGTQGQLFSVTDSLTGDLFSVSDISGVPILNVNSSGVVSIEGAQVPTGTGTANKLTKWNSAGTGLEDTNISVVVSGSTRQYTINGGSSSSGINLLTLNKNTGGASDRSMLFRIGTTQNDIVSDAHSDTGELRFRLMNAAGTESSILELNSNGNITVPGYGTGYLKTDSNGAITADNSTFLTSSSTQTKYLRSDIADDASGRIVFNGCNTNNHDTIATSTGSLGGIEIYNNGAGNDSFMTFHVGGDFACYFGLDGGTNKLSVGGWSMGAASYEIYHSGNKPSLSALGAQAAGTYSTATGVANNADVTPSWVPSSNPNYAGIGSNNTFTGTNQFNANVTFDTTTVRVNTGVHMDFGDTSMFRLRHSGSGGHMHFTNRLHGAYTYIQSEDAGGNVENLIKLGGSGGEVNLSYGGAYKLSTASNGVTIAGSMHATSSVGTNFSAGSSGQQMEPGDASQATLRCDANRWRVYMGADNGETLTVTETGRVGIDDSSPDYPLDVNGNVSSISIYASHDIAAYSDARVKGDIKTIPDALDKVNKLRGVTFVRTDEGASDKRMMGVIAQEVKDIIPEVVTARESDGHYAVSYGNIVGLLIESIKELTAEVEELKKCGKCDNCNCKNK